MAIDYIVLIILAVFFMFVLGTWLAVEIRSKARATPRAWILRS